MAKIMMNGPRLAAVIGAGPSGMYAARDLAAQGVDVVLLNRDIKPGGLAEYGIYPDKLKIKMGLRQQFRQFLTLPKLHYFGNVVVGKQCELTLADLLGMGFQALVVTVGAQATKWLRLPGEDLRGVYHAKDLVFHYNALPPYTRREFKIGKRVAIVGGGNVMTDIAYSMTHLYQADEVYVIVRRGPLQARYEKKELERIIPFFDMEDLEAELNRIAPVMRSMGEDPEKTLAEIRMMRDKAPQIESNTHIRLRFLMSPQRMRGDENGSVCGLDVEENDLVLENGQVKAHGTGLRQYFDVDTVIFAIGDRVDDHLGLPVAGYQYAQNPQPLYPVEDTSYEAFDPQSGQPIEGVFLAGWAREASTGLVGIARRDGSNAARAVLRYLQNQPPVEEGQLERVLNRISSLPCPVVTAADLLRLDAEEEARAQKEGLETFKFGTNEEMLAVMGLLKK